MNKQSFETELDNLENSEQSGKRGRGRPIVPYHDVVISRGVSLPLWMWVKIDTLAEKNKRSAWIQKVVGDELKDTDV